MIDYKKIIKSRCLRLMILNLLSFIPDKWMLKFQYRMKTGRRLNLKNPQRFSEKLQWYKLYYRNPLMAQCVDKFEVRKYIESIDLKFILNECYGVFDNPEDVDFEKLPNSFVLKDTLGGGGNSVIICKDKSKENFDKIRNVIRKWTSVYVEKSAGREWVYERRKHRIIIEKYIASEESKGGLIDYKIHCFNGKAKIVQVLADRVFGVGAGCGTFDIDFNKLDVCELEEFPLKREIKKPNNYKDLISVAEKIATGFPYIRVDLYNQDEKILFGEMTFFDASGYQLYNPDVFDYRMGSFFDIKK